MAVKMRGGLAVVNAIQEFVLAFRQRFEQHPNGFQSGLSIDRLISLVCAKDIFDWSSVLMVSDDNAHHVSAESG
jgi:hypothetical protein